MSLEVEADPPKDLDNKKPPDTEDRMVEGSVVKDPDNRRNEKDLSEWVSKKGRKVH